MDNLRRSETLWQRLAMKPIQVCAMSSLIVVALWDDNHGSFDMVTVPLMTLSGEVTGLYGRRAEFRQSRGSEQHVGRGLFNATAIQRFDELIVTESVLDAWVFFAADTSMPSARWAVNCSSSNLRGCGGSSWPETIFDCEAFTDIELPRLVWPAGMSVHRYCLEHPADRTERLASRANAPLQGSSFAPDPAGPRRRWRSPGRSPPAGGKARLRTSHELSAGLHSFRLPFSLFLGQQLV